MNHDDMIAAARAAVKRAKPRFKSDIEAYVDDLRGELEQTKGADPEPAPVNRQPEPTAPAAPSWTGRTDRRENRK